MSSEVIESLRHLHKPAQIRWLFVGESPPAGGTFFYRADSNLFRYTRQAFSAAYEIDFNNGAEFLTFFQPQGCYLIDLCEEPINHIKANANTGVTSMLPIFTRESRILLHRPSSWSCRPSSNTSNPRQYWLACQSCPSTPCPSPPSATSSATWRLSPIFSSNCESRLSKSNNEIKLSELQNYGTFTKSTVILE